MLSKHGSAGESRESLAATRRSVNKASISSSGHSFEPDPSSVTHSSLPPPWRNPKHLSPECEQMFVQPPPHLPPPPHKLFMMSSLYERAPATATQAPSSLDAVNIYPLAIIAAPSGLGATARWVNTRRRWEINEQCASGCGWEEPPAARAPLKAMTCTCGKGRRGPRQTPRCRLQRDSRARASSYRVHAGSDPRENSSRAEWPFTEHRFAVTEWKASSLSVVTGCTLWEV